MRGTEFVETGDTLRAVVPAELSTGSFLGAAFGLLAWVVALLPVFITLLLRRVLDQPDSPMLLVFWLPALGFAPLFLLGLFGLAWMVGGREVIEVAAASLTVDRVLFGVRVSSRTFRREDVAFPRVSPRPYVSRANVWRVFLAGMLAFDYGAATYRMGGGLSADEAERLARALEAGS